MTSTLVRSAQPDDIVALVRVATATFRLACPPSTSDEDIAAYVAAELTPAKFREHLGCRKKSLFAAMVDNDLVGYLMLCREAAPSAVESNKPLELRRLYVLPQYHGKGISDALMERAVAVALTEDCTGLWLAVSLHNHRGLGFYRKHGFAIVGAQSFSVGTDIHEDYIMVRHLA